MPDGVSFVILELRANIVRIAEMALDYGRDDLYDVVIDDDWDYAEVQARLRDLFDIQELHSDVLAALEDCDTNL